MNILLAGGGTGGHVYPALAVAEELRRKYSKINIGYVGTARGLESRIVRREPDIEFFEIESSGIERDFSLKTFGSAIENLKGLSQSLQIFAEFEPQAILGTGGYVSFSPLLWGALLRLPTLIHEQNRIPGLANRILAPFVDSVLVSYPDTAKELCAKRTVCTGLPIRSSIASGRGKSDKSAIRKSLGLATDRPLLLVMGGTHGAQIIHDQLINSLRRFTKQKIQLVILAGRDAERLRENTPDHESLRILGHTHDVGKWMQAADLMICRAGASSLAEITALGVPSIVIPWPGAAHNHQEANAAWLAERGACRLLPESACQGTRLIDESLTLLNDPQQLEQLRNRCKEIAKPDAAEQVMREVVLHLEHGKQREAIPLYRHWRRWNERLGLDFARTRSFRQRFGL